MEQMSSEFFCFDPRRPEEEEEDHSFVVDIEDHEWSNFPDELMPDDWEESDVELLIEEYDDDCC